MAGKSTPRQIVRVLKNDEFVLPPDMEAKAMKALEESEEFKGRAAEITSFRVYSRVRPFIREELDEMEGQERRSIVEMVDNRTILLDPTKNWSPKAQFEFDASLWSIPPTHQLVYTFQDARRKEFASQKHVYDLVAKDLVPHVFKGYNSCILTYGQTGSGKTYTMMGEYSPGSTYGENGQEGIIPRISNDLFIELARVQEEENKKRATKGQTSVRYRVEVSFVEIYMERVRDLLDPGLRNSKGNERLHDARIRQDPYSGPFVEGVTKYQVENWAQCCILLERGSSHRTTCATAVHQQSSRSHAIYQLTVIRETTKPKKGRYDRPTVETRSGRINLVDLAGSERGGFQEYVKESAAINTSLLALRRCIDCLTQRQTMLMDQLRGEILDDSRVEKSLPQVPFRDSVLTWLLSDSIGGNARTTMIATLSPLVNNYRDTLATLQWSSKARNLVTLVKKNDTSLVAGSLTSQRGELGSAMQAANNTLDGLRAALKNKQLMTEKLAREAVEMRKATLTADKRTEFMLREMAAVVIQRAYQTGVYRQQLKRLQEKRAMMEAEHEESARPVNVAAEELAVQQRELEAKAALRAAEQETEAAADELQRYQEKQEALEERRNEVKARYDRIKQRLSAELNKRQENPEVVQLRNLRAEHKEKEERLAKYKAKIEESHTDSWQKQYGKPPAAASKN